MTIFNVDNYLSRHFNKTETGDFFVAVLNFLSASTHNRTFVSWDVSFIDIWPMIKSACHYLNIDPETCVLDGIFAVIDPKQYNMPIMQDRYAFRNLGNPSVALNQAEPDSGPMLLHMIGRPTWQRTAVTAWCWYHHRNRVKISYQLSENFMDQQGLDTFWKETRPDSKWHDVFSAWCSRDNIS